MIPINAAQPTPYNQDYQQFILPQNVLQTESSIPNRLSVIRSSSGMLPNLMTNDAFQSVEGGGNDATDSPNSFLQTSTFVKGTAGDKMEKSLVPLMDILGYSTRIMDGLTFGERSAIVWDFIVSHRLGQSYVGELCGVARGDVTKTHLTSHRFNDLSGKFTVKVASAMAMTQYKLDPERLKRMCQWYLACVKNPEQFGAFLERKSIRGTVMWRFKVTGRTSSLKKRQPHNPTHPFTVSLQKAKTISRSQVEDLAKIMKIMGFESPLGIPQSVTTNLLDSFRRSTQSANFAQLGSAEQFTHLAPAAHSAQPVQSEQLVPEDQPARALQLLGEVAAPAQQPTADQVAQLAPLANAFAVFVQSGIFRDGFLGAVSTQQQFPLTASFPQATGNLPQSVPLPPSNSGAFSFPNSNLFFQQ